MFTYKFEDLALAGMKAFDGVYSVELEVSLEDKKQFLDSINPDTEAIIAELTALNVACKDGSIKHNKYSSVNASSFKTYIKNNFNKLYYGYVSSRYSRCEAHYFLLDDAQITFSDWNIDRTIDEINDYKRRFHNFIDRAVAKEDLAVKRNSENDYKDSNRARIDAGNKAYKLMNSFDVTVPYAISEGRRAYDDEMRYEIQNSSLRHFYGWSDSKDMVTFSTNSYGELTRKGAVVDEDKAEKISNLILKYGKKISVLMDDLNDDIREVLGE